MSVTTFLLDTSIIIDWERSLADDDPLSSSTWVVSAMTVAELNLGALRARSAQSRQRRLETFMFVASSVVLPFDDTCARTYAELIAWAEDAGYRPPLADAIIAATAATHGLPLATRDRALERLAGFAGLDVHLA